MKKLSSILCIGLIFILFSSCERPDLTSDVEYAYNTAKNSCQESGAFKCSGITSYKCEYGFWSAYEKCDSGCDESTGKCSTSDSESSSGSCTTIDGYMWSPKASSIMDWESAVSYCNNLTECGYSDWHLPTISELRTLIKNCSGTQMPGGSCGVTDSCLSYSNCWSDSCYCDYIENNGGYYSKLGDDDNVWLWSSSSQSDFTNFAWFVFFYHGSVSSNLKDGSHDVRCVR